VSYIKEAKHAIKNLTREFHEAASDQVVIPVNQLSLFTIANALVTIAERDNDPLLIVLQLPSGEFINLAGFVQAAPFPITDADDGATGESVGVRITWLSGDRAFYGEDAQVIIDWLAMRKRG
jgi:hypothetical protein